MLSRFQNLVRGCLLSVGVARNGNGKLAVVEPVPQAPVATRQAEESEDRFSAWEKDRAVTLNDAEQAEQQGLRHLTKAALLRLVVYFEDEGLFVVAHELRQQADAC